MKVILHKSTVTAVSLCALVEIANATPPGGQYPQCWMWSRPDPTQPAWTDKHLAPMARINEGCDAPFTPEHTADLLAVLVRDLIAADQLPRTAQEAPILCVNIQNLGNFANGQPNDSLFNSQDNVDVDLDNNPATNDWPASGPLPQSLQPWMTHGRANTKLWMQQFIAEYEYLRLHDPNFSTLVPWDRFHLDHESAITATGTENWPFLLMAMVVEDDNLIDDGAGHMYNRWNWVHVPGFN